MRVIAAILAVSGFACAEADESVQGVAQEEGWVETADGTRLRTFVTAPEDASGPMPAIYYVQWLSCDSVTVTDAQNGWNLMLKGVVEETGALVMRMDKRGVGDSEGACASLDYDTELNDHRRGLQAMLDDPRVDPDRVYVYGASMGATMAPILASEIDAAGVIAWGGGARTWFERQMAFERHAMELAGSDMTTINDRMADAARFYHAYLFEGLTPPEIAESRPELASVTDSLTGFFDGTHFGRPYAFHQQAQAHDWAEAWFEANAPALIMYGEYDWFETLQGHQLAAQAVEQAGHEAELVVFEATDHHFSRFPSPEAAFDTRGEPMAGEVVDTIVEWLEERP